MRVVCRAKRIAHLLSDVKTALHTLYFVVSIYSKAALFEKVHARIGQTGRHRAVDIEAAT